MSKIKITADSACDCSKELLDKYEIDIIPFKVLIDGEDKLDGINVNGADIVEYVAKTDIIPRTGAPSIEDYTKFFETQIKDYDYLIHYCISSEFSVAYSNAVKASEKFNGKVRVVDTRTLSTGISMNMINGKELADAGKTPDEICEACKKIAKCTQTSFTLEDLRMLYKGGRCNGLTFFIGKTLGLKPSLLIRNGKLGVNKKYMLQKFDVIVKRYVLDILKQFPNIDKRRCFVTHTPTDENVVKMVKDIASQYFDEVLDTDAGATVCTHCGKNTIGILYLCNEEIK